MIELIHHTKPKQNTAFHHGMELNIIERSTIGQLIELALRFPKEWIGWSTVKKTTEDWKELERIAHSPHIMVSDGLMPQFLALGIDYIEDTPFINFAENAWYPTWLMSIDSGLIHASVLKQVARLKSYGDFEYDINMLSRKFQPQGIFCYSNLKKSDILEANNFQLYSFIAQTRKRRWLLFLLVSHLIFEKRFPFFAFAKANLLKYYELKINVSLLYSKKEDKSEDVFLYDVIIPTMGRPGYLKNVLLDLEGQDIIPQKVVIIEQNSHTISTSELGFIKEIYWSFEIVHEFTCRTGACRARNSAINLTTAPWVLFFDDDNRFPDDLLKRVAIALKETNSKVLNLAYSQKNEQETQKGYLQWAFFGSGSSIVHRDALKECKFDMALEHGYGEDVDYGMQLRNKGFDVIYAPEIQVLHLKAPMGGFRMPFQFDWSQDAIQPLPSPHIMYFRKKNFSSNQLKGYKLRLIIENCRRYNIKNPFRYYHLFKKRWNVSVHYSGKLNEQG